MVTPFRKKKFSNKTKIQLEKLDNIYWPKLFHTILDILTSFFSTSVHSFNHSTSVHVGAYIKMVHIYAKYCLFRVLLEVGKANH